MSTELFRLVSYEPAMGEQIKRVLNEAEQRERINSSRCVASGQFHEAVKAAGRAEGYAQAWSLIEREAQSVGGLIE